MCLRNFLDCFVCCKKKRRSQGLDETTFYEYADVEPVYLNKHVGTLHEGLSIAFLGHISLTCERFSINFKLENSTGDIALHINPRLPQNYIVRNSRKNHVWGPEEVTSTMPFSLRRGCKFTAQVLVTEQEYKISINGYHFTEYRHRLPYINVRTIEVLGDVTIVDVKSFDTICYPDRLPQTLARDIEMTKGLAAILAENSTNDKKENEPKNVELPASSKSPKTPVDDGDGRKFIPTNWKHIQNKLRTNAEMVIATNAMESPSLMDNVKLGLHMPYYGRLQPGTLINGRCLRIDGRVKLLPHSFYVNLQTTQQIWPHPTIAFHLNPRFSKQSRTLGKAIIVRNAWYNGAWAKEEVSELDTDFLPGKTFSLAIICCENRFEVYVNAKFLTEFKYHIPPDTVDTLYIRGDIKLWSVKLDEVNLRKSLRQSVAVNDGYELE